MLRQLILAAILVTLVRCQVSKKCQKAYKAFPPPGGRVNIRPVKTTSVNTCSMLAETCCSPVTEYLMKQKAGTDFTALALSTINGRLAKVNAALAENSLTPIVFHQGFNDLVKKEGDVNYRELTRSAFGYYIKDSCMQHKETRILKQRVGTYVHDIADFLKALYNGLETIKKVLEIVSEYKVSDTCQTAVMKNGLYTDTTFGISMCQVCHRDTAVFLPCPSTCKNVARGCLKLTEVGALLNDLATVLDRIHHQLLVRTERPSSDLAYLEEDIKFSFERSPDFAARCATGAAYTYVENDSQAQPANFTANPLNLNNVIESSADYACLKSEPLTGNCWTEAGVTEVDSNSVDAFTTQAQRANNILPRAEVQSDDVIKAEDMLRKATELAQRAYGGQDMFNRDTTEAPEIMPTEKTNDESETSGEEETDMMDEEDEEDENQENNEESEDDSDSEEDVTNEGGDEEMKEEEMKDEDKSMPEDNDVKEEEKEKMDEKKEDMEKEEESEEEDAESDKTGDEKMENETDGKDPNYNVADEEEKTVGSGEEEASTDKKPAESSTSTIYLACQLILLIALRLI